MTSATLQTPQNNISALEKEFPDLRGERMEDGTIQITLKNRPSHIWVDYEQVAPTGGTDPWRYRLSHATAQTEWVGPFSHPTEKGCWIMARKYFAENHFLPVPIENTHLSKESMAIYLEAQAQRTLRRVAARHPETGDFIRDADGALRRVCACYDDRCQTTTALERSYSTSNSGIASYSGSLGSAVSYSDLTKRQETERALFWIFRDGITGAGRAVELWIDVTVWDYPGLFGSGLWWGR